MGKPNGRAALFAIRLRKEMDSRGLSVRSFGKLTDPSNPERGRRRVQRHLSGSFMPSPASRKAYAVALGLPEESFLDDDEEEDLHSPLTRAVRAAVRVELRSALERVKS